LRRRVRCDRDVSHRCAGEIRIASEGLLWRSLRSKHLSCWNTAGSLRVRAAIGRQAFTKDENAADRGQCRETAGALEEAGARQLRLRSGIYFRVFASCGFV
jgi:hypothetical protein